MDRAAVCSEFTLGESKIHEGRQRRAAGGRGAGTVRRCGDGASPEWTKETETRHNGVLQCECEGFSIPGHQEERSQHH